ncbi:MAG: hypothetical protein ACRC67_08650 [Inquilinus sp.]|uniref:hypothetical protein n=1 Tax=Inquilinus sp. TaxID=1932117 RepID=UPI003F2D42C6
MTRREEPLWCDDERRNDVLADPAHPLNGVDYVEYRRDILAPPAQRHRVEVEFIKPPPPALFGAPGSFSIEGGIRIVGVTVLNVVPDADPNRAIVFVDREGDLSTYWLHVSDPGIDPERSEAPFSFKASCPTEFDCKPRHDCDPPAFIQPALDYLAKDYQSFRRLMMDLAPQLNPDFTERNPADLAVTLIELFAYVGDDLSYAQDAAATEAFFDTCRHRISAGRHARLVDYAMHDGRNAFGFVQFDAAAGGDGTVPAGAKLLTRVIEPLSGMPAAPDLIIPAGAADLDGDPALAHVTVFETAAPVRVLAARNLVHIHDWGDSDCCLARGARDLWLYVTAPAGADLAASRPDFVAGEYLLLEEVLGPRTGLPQDADPRNRQVVRIEAVEDAADPVFRDVLVGGVLTPAGAGDPPLPLLHVHLREVDATAMPFCLSAEDPLSHQLIAPITIIRGNVTPADHGRTVVRLWPDPTDPQMELPAPDIAQGRWPIDVQSLGEGPLTFQTMPTDPTFAPDGRLTTGRHDLDQPAGAATAAITVEYGWDGLDTELFRPVPSLIGSDVYDDHFVAEVDNRGIAHLRFGDDQYGRRLGQPNQARARYRLGNGRPGNIGAGALTHVIVPDAADLVDPANPGGPPLPFPAMTALRQPLAARGGTDPQAIEEVRQLAPEAFRAETYRAVTEADYEAASNKLPGVAAAKASFVWTGSWHTVFVAIHPSDPATLLRLPGGQALLAPAFANAVTAAISRYRLAGYDLVVRAAIYVPIELEIQLCIRRGHFRGEVLEVATNALSNRRLPGGALGFFHPLNFRFGAPVYASRIYALLQEIDAVESATIRVMKRYWDLPNGELERGVVPMGPAEVARLDNDPNQPEFGVLRLTAVGGL